MPAIIDAHLDGATLHLVVKVARLGAAEARGFKQESEAIWSDAVTAVEIDLGGVLFIDSSGIGALLSVYKKLPAGTPSVKLTNVTATVQSVIELLRLHRIFELEN
jgi:anti-anti-sigma factor